MFAEKVVEKDNDNKHVIDSKKIKSFYSKMYQESPEAFKALSKATMHSNLKEWAEEECCFKKMFINVFQ